MKKTELIFNFISIPVDVIMLLLAGIFSFYIREHSLSLIGPIIFQLQLQAFLMSIARVILFIIMIFAALGLYNLKGTRNFTHELKEIIIGVSLGLLIVILLFFFNQTVFPSRFIILATWGLGIILVAFGRVFLKFFQRQLFLRNIGLHKLAVISGSKTESGIIEKVYKNRKFGYELVAELDFDSEILSKLGQLFLNRGLDGILQANASLSDANNLKLVQFSRANGLEFSFVPNLFEVQRNAVETSTIKGIPVISLKNTPLDGWGKVAKRILDILVSSFCLVITSPIFLVIAIAVKFDSSGKIIYSAPRKGRGKNFQCYKFRSMYSHLSVGDEYGGSEAEKVRQQLWQNNDRGGKDGPFLKIKHDPRVTKVGRFLRKSKLDELPQFWNVLQGSMSMVGPRAHVLDEVQKYEDRYRRMFSIKPGIFGMSQIAQLSWPDLPFEEEIKLNTFYIENWSLWLDVKVLAKSFWWLFFESKPKEDY